MATCITPATCEICGKTYGGVSNHNYTQGTCNTPAQCQVCGKVSENPIPHTFTEATCTSPKTCKYCGLTQGTTIDHKYTIANKTTPAKCKMCGKLYGHTIDNIYNIMQKPALPNGCEVVSLAIVLNYLGYDIDPLTLYNDYMPKSPYKAGDPWETYVGDATGLGLGCYAPCVALTGNRYLGYLGSQHRVYTASGKELSEYEKYLDEGIPVIFWGLINMNGVDRYAWNDYFNGEKVVWHSFSHCLVLIGYTDNGYIFCDPLEGVIEYPKADVEKSFEINFRQACVILK